MTFLEICNALQNAGIESYSYEAKILCEEICGEFNEEKDYNSEALVAAIEKRAEGYPLQYILGKWWFWDCEFYVSPDCLIPRPDTEHIVEKAVKLLPKNANFADLCTGSGCIAISVLHSRGDTHADAYELYPNTLDIAKKNAEFNGVSDRFDGILGDVLKKETLFEKKYHAIISNPPYIRADVIPTLSREVHFEPHAALDGGEDGLIFYRSILDNFYDNLYDGGMFIFEIGYDQGDDLKKMAADRNLRCEIYRDFSGNDRCVIIYKN